MEGIPEQTASSEEGRALRGARQGVGQSSVKKAEGRADCVTRKQISVKGRAEVKARTGKNRFSHSFFPCFVLHESAFSLGTK